MKTDRSSTPVLSKTASWQVKKITPAPGTRVPPFSISRRADRNTGKTGKHIFGFRVEKAGCGVFQFKHL
jgi:hypothetical protein